MSETDIFTKSLLGLTLCLGLLRKHRQKEAWRSLHHWKDHKHLGSPTLRTTASEVMGPKGLGPGTALVTVSPTVFLEVESPKRESISKVQRVCSPILVPPPSLPTSRPHTRLPVVPPALLASASRHPQPQAPEADSGPSPLVPCSGEEPYHPSG